MSYPSASTPDPSVHYAEPVPTGQLAFAASEMEAIGQNLLGGFIRQVVLAFLGAVTGNTLPAFLSQLSTFSNSLQSDIAGATKEINSMISGVGGTVASDVSTAINTANSNASGALNSIVQGFDNTVTTVDQTVTQAQSAISNAVTGWFNAWANQSFSAAASSDVANAAASSVTTAQNHSQQISAIQSQLPSFYGGGGGGGLHESVSLNGSLPSGFTALAAAATIAVSAARYGTVAMTDSQTVSGVWNSSDGYAKYLFLRANSAFTTYVYVKIQANNPSTGAANCEIGCAVAGKDTTFTTFALPGNGTLIANSPYSLAAVEDVFTVTGPNGLNVSYTDSAGVSQIGSSYRYGGFGTDGFIRQSDTYFTAGSVSYTPPSWADSLDVVVVGAGGGGMGGYSTQAGQGGGYGGAQYGSITPSQAGSGAWTGAVGAGGAPGAPNAGAGGTGAASTLTFPSGTQLSGAGGYGGDAPNSAQAGGGGQSVVVNNNLYTFGAVQNNPQGAAGNSPGGGGSGGGAAINWGGTDYPGGAGAPGGIWITAVDTTVPGSLAYWAFYDNAPAGPATATVATSESTSSTTYTDLTTTTDEVTVKVGTSGVVLVAIQTEITYASGSGGNPLLSFAMSGANTQAATDGYAAGSEAYPLTPGFGATFPLFGLTAGATTFKLKYRVSGATWAYSNRRIGVIPF